jgi:hypothetical protein
MPQSRTRGCMPQPHSVDQAATLPDTLDLPQPVMAAFVHFQNWLVEPVSARPMSGLLCSLKRCQSRWRMPETVLLLSHHDDSTKRCPDDLTPRSPIPHRHGRAPFPYRAFTGGHHSHSKSIPERRSHSSDVNEELGCNRDALACRPPISFLYCEHLGATMGW